jgi:TonB family protein
MNAKAVLLFLGIACPCVLLNAQALQKVPAEAAGARVGEVVTICGMAIDLGCDAPDPMAVVTLLTPYAAPTFGVAITREDRSRFGLLAEDRYIPRHLCVTGEIERSHRGYRVSASRADQLHFDAESERAPTPLATEALYRSCDEGVVPPKLLRSVPVSYTPEAMRAGIDGSVLLQGVVGRDASMRDVQVLCSLDPSSLDQAAVRAFKQWRFRPGTRLGKEVSVIVTAQMAFTLKK